MNLSQILQKITAKYDATLSGRDLEIQDIAIDSRKIKPAQNTIFFATKGKSSNGEDFIDDAIKNGAKIIVSKNSHSNKNANFIKTENVFSFLVQFLQIFYPNLPQNIYAVTGTNGKTSVAEFCRQILEISGKKSASIGTMGVNCDGEIKSQLANSSLTTPDIITLYKNLAILKKHNIDDIFIETSSIGLDQNRIAGLNISSAAFTNFTQDHLDYHQNMQNYFDCKMILFQEILQNNGAAIINSDIEKFSEIKKNCQQRNLKIIDYGKNAHDFKIEETFGDARFSYKNQKYNFKNNFSSEFQIYNLLCALALVNSIHDFDKKKLAQIISQFEEIKSPIGRMQKIATKNGASIFIDFAHSPDALQNILQNARKLNPAKLLILFGCGGNRDRKKRPLMAKIASEFADKIIITDDNPRNENPATIRQEILAACDKEKTIEIANRKNAIEKSLQMLESGDILILAGKGHEKYQIIGDQKIEFDEEKIVKNLL